MGPPMAALFFGSTRVGECMPSQSPHPPQATRKAFEQICPGLLGRIDAYPGENVADHHYHLYVKYDSKDVLQAAGVSVKHIFPDNIMIRVGLTVRKNSFSWHYDSYSLHCGPADGDTKLVYFRSDFHPRIGPKEVHCHLRGYGKEPDEGSDHLTPRQVDPWIGHDVYLFLDCVERFRNTGKIPVQRKLP